MIQRIGLVADGSVRTQYFHVLRTRAERLCGLLGTDRQAEPVVLMRCSSIHTFGMGYPIDVAIVGGDGTVLTARRALPSGRVHSCRGGFLTLERPASEEEWFEAGQRLRANSLTVVYDAALQGGKIP